MDWCVGGAPAAPARTDAVWVAKIEKADVAPPAMRLAHAVCRLDFSVCL